MEHPKATPKDFFLWAGAMVALYGGIIAFIGLLFDYIAYALPDALSYGYYGNPYQGSVAYEMASLIVLAPLCLVLMRLIRRDIARDQSRQDVWVRRWALFLTLFVAGATITIDLIVLITTFLSGEALTAAFLLKVMVVLLVAGAGFLHFMADLWGYWARHPSYARYVMWAVGLLVVVSILSGFYIIGTPSEARQMRLDEQRVSDLQNIQWQVVNYWQQKETLPKSIDDLPDPISGYQNPLDPQSGSSYVYRATGQMSFELCAMFGTARSYPNPSYARPVTAIPASEKMGWDSWEHKAGETCFVRTIDPERYPPLNNK